MNMCQVNQPAIRPVSMTLFPTMGSLQEVLDFAESKLPITCKNDIHSLLMTYQNTLLSILEQETNFVPRKAI